MNRKIIFLDIDGTIVKQDLTISEKVRTAIRKARENGHYVCIATGRSMAEVPRYIQELDCDGYVAGTGSSIIWQGKSLREETLPTQLMDGVLKEIEALGCIAVLEGMEYIYIRQSAWDKLLAEAEEKPLAKMIIGAYSDVNRRFNDISQVDRINKITYFGINASKEQVSEIGARYNLDNTAFPAYAQLGMSGELTINKYNKGEAILALASYLGISRDDVMAIGDGENDITMLRAAGISIAMGNAGEAVKKAATEVTASVSEDGIYIAFKKHGLI